MAPSNKLVGNPSQFHGMIPKLTPQLVFSADTGSKACNTSTFRCFGVEFALLANEAQLMQDAIPYLPAESELCDPASVNRRYSLVHRHHLRKSRGTPYALYRDGRRIYTCSDRRDLMEHFSATIALDMAEASPTRTFVHAGVVGWGQSAILVPGRSFSGKTTLVAKLIQAGATYYSDEFAVIDRLGMVYPYPRPLQVRQSGSYRQTPYPAEKFGGVPGVRALPVGLVLVTRYLPEAHWLPRQLSPGVGLLKLLDNTVSARRSPATALSTLKQVVSHARIVKGVRGEASQVMEWVTAHFSSPNKQDEPTR